MYTQPNQYAKKQVESNVESHYKQKKFTQQVISQKINQPLKRSLQNRKVSYYFDPKIKLFVLLIKNWIQRQLRQNFTKVVCHSRRYTKNISSLQLIVSKYQNCRLLTMKLSFSKIIAVAEGYKFAQRKFKNTLILITRLQSVIKANCFRNIFRFGRINNEIQQSFQKVNGSSAHFRRTRLSISQNSNKKTIKLKRMKSFQLQTRSLKYIKSSLFVGKIQAMYNKKLSKHFNSIASYLCTNKNVLKQDKLRIFSIITNKLLKNILLCGFNSIYSYGFLNQIRMGSLVQDQNINKLKGFQSENRSSAFLNMNIEGKRDYKKNISLSLSRSGRQIDSSRFNQMAIQLQNKNKSIDKLNQEICEIKKHLSARNNYFSLIQNEEPQHKSYENQDFSYSYHVSKPEKTLQYYNTGQNTQSIASLLLPQNRRSQKNLGDHAKTRQNGHIKKDASLHSLLNTSFLSFKSKDSRLSGASLSKKKTNSILSGMITSNYHGIPNIDCTCIFRHKSKQYKTLNESIKNQLQIMKKELEVAKDLNEHFQNQLKIYGGRPQQDQQQQIEKLTLSIEQINKENDQLKQKISKYQKHVGSMKSQFKRKMQEIYRRVKKDL